LGTSYVISNTESGEYTVTVKAISSNSVYSESLSSNSVLYVKPFVLATPVISLSGNTVSWQAVENATAYEVTVNGVAQTVQDTSFTVNNVDAGEYTITVKAISNDVHYTTSSLSAPVVYVKADKLSVPQVTLQGDTVNWEPVQNATSYVISMVGIAPVSVEGSVVTETVETTSYTLEMAYTGEYSVTVKAVCGSAEYADSPESAALHYDNYKRIDPNEYLAMHRVWAPDPDGNGIQNHGGVIADNVYLEENGDVVITANGSYYEGNKKGISSVENYAANYGGKRTGGVIISKDTYGPGSFEVVMKIPAFNDIVSTIWLYKWLEGYEDYNHEMDIEIYGATPWGGDASFDYAMCSTWLRETDPYHDVQTVPVKYKLNDGKLHTYRFDWHLGDNPHADFYMDNVYICSNYKAIPTNEMNMNIGCWFASWGGASNFETDSLVIKSFKYTPFDNEEATRYDCGTIIPNAAGQYRNINRGTAPKTNLISNYNFNASRDNFVWDTSAGTITNGKLNGTVSQNVEGDAAGITYDLTVKASGKIKIKVTYSSIADTPSKGSVEFEFESTSLTEKTFRFTPPPDAKAPDDFRQHQNGVTALIIEITSDSGATVEYVYMTEHDACGR
ncbi:MAG: glycoside hydrolase family 16 protein, partial [Clostridia bacterium]|nr:glycoside hydrolase family 16 protein [Clostridia bacterium]